MIDRPTPSDPLRVALREAAELLSTRPAQAAQQAHAILKSHPGHPHALLVVGVARRIGGNLEGALQILLPLARAQPGWAMPAYELGVALGATGRRKEALSWLRRAVQLQADIGEAWSLIANHLLALGDAAGADAAYANHQIAAMSDPRLAAPARALLRNQLGEADALLRDHIRDNPTDVVALRMLAQVAMRQRRNPAAEQMLAHCLTLAPHYHLARHDHALVLHRLARNVEALAELEPLLASDPRNPAYLSLKAGALVTLGDHQQASETYATIVADHPHHAGIWTRYGHTLRTTGHAEAAISAYRRAIEIAPGLGEAWWALANMKTLRFSTLDVSAMRQQLARSDLGDSDRVHLRFALGKALEDCADYAESFRQYAEGNRLHRSATSYDPEMITSLVKRSCALFSGAFLAAREGWGASAPDPIFVVGLPRSGSTLVEQILASHAAVEGTMELPNVVAIARSLVASRRDAEVKSYPELLGTLGADECRALGERYIEQTRVYRRKGTPFFIDKLPNNWEHIGLIHLMLPHARIIDVRRDAIGCCFSCFKQLFAGRQDFAYDLRDLGRYYRDYVDLMAHFDRVLPGRVHRVNYRRLVEDTEAEVRRMLDYCRLPFEDGCLRFHENPRAVHSPSSEQVRTPITRDAIDHWRHFEPWLGPLKETLGPLADG